MMPSSSRVVRCAAAAATTAWSLERDLPELLEACAAVATEDAFVLLTAHTTGLAPDDLAAAAETAFGRPAEPAELLLRATSGARLPLGASARIITG